MQLGRYWSSACPQCTMKSQCTPSTERRITRREHESLLEGVQRRLDKTPDAMTIRRRTVEHVFGTFKHWMGYTHFLIRKLPNVGTEMSLSVLARLQPHESAENPRVQEDNEGDAAGGCMSTH